MAPELQVLAGRPGWTVLETAAVYAPEPGGWTARVFPLRAPGRSSYSRFHISVIDPSGRARHVFQAITAQEAARVAERRVPRSS